MGTTVTNKQSTFESGVNPDYDAYTENVTDGGTVRKQFVGIDIGTSGTPSKVTSTNPLPVYLSTHSPVNEFIEVGAVVSSVETTVISYVPGATFHIQGFSVTGSAAGRFKLKVGGVTKAILRTTAAKTSEMVSYLGGVIVVSSGTTVLVTGFHEETANQVLAANLFGYTV